MTGAIYVTVVVLCSILGGITLQVVFGIITALMLHEFAQLFKDSKYCPSPILLSLYGTLMYFIGSSATLFVSTEGANFLLLPFFILLFLSVIFFGSFELTQKSTTPVANAAINVMGLLYIVPAMTFIPFLSIMGPSEGVNTFPLLGIFIMIWCSDTFAYLVGRKIGKTKLAPTISPNKSWEGFIGGMIFTLIAGVIIAYFQEGEPYLAYLVLAIVCSCFGLLGDLFESMIKRKLQLKDSGNILPGHGGILDRFDSVLFVMPIAFIVCFIFTFLIQ